MDANKSVTAIFSTIPTYTLDITALNGSVTVDPPGPVYNEGTEVTLNPIPDAGYRFDSWADDLTGNDKPAIITMNADKSVTANFCEEISLIKNGDFSDGINHWEIVLTGEDADANFSVESGEAYVEIIVDDGINWHICLTQDGINLIKGHSYTLSCDARAVSDRDIIFKVQSYNQGGLVSLKNTRRSISTTMTNVSHTWTHENLNESYVFQVFLGDEGLNHVWLDNIMLVDNTGGTYYNITSVAGDNGSISPLGETEEIGLLKNEVLTCYPNPFSNSRPFLSYKLSESGYTSLEVYNNYGQEVANLFDGYQTQGQYGQSWKAVDSNGKLYKMAITSIRLESENTVKTIKVLLMQ